MYDITMTVNYIWKIGIYFNIFKKNENKNHLLVVGEYTY